VPGSILLGLLASFAEGWLDGRYVMLPATVVFIMVGNWCSLNFARCREAHCLITGAGFMLVGLVAIVAAVLDRDWSDALWLAALATLVGGVLFEAVWTAHHGGNALRRSDRRSPTLELGEDRARPHTDRA